MVVLAAAAEQERTPLSLLAQVARETLLAHLRRKAAMEVLVILHLTGAAAAVVVVQVR
jgi:hypothetical protein